MKKRQGGRKDRKEERKEWNKERNNKEIKSSEQENSTMFLGIVC